MLCLPFLVLFYQLYHTQLYLYSLVPTTMESLFYPKKNHYNYKYKLTPLHSLLKDQYSFGKVCQLLTKVHQYSCGKVCQLHTKMYQYSCGKVCQLLTKMYQYSCGKACQLLTKMYHTHVVVCQLVSYLQRCTSTPLVKLISDL